MQSTILWRPDRTRIESTAMFRFMTKHGFAFYNDLHRWSIDHPEEFWPAIKAFCDVQFMTAESTALLRPTEIANAGWFPDATLNFAAHLLRHDGANTALVFCGENGERRTLSREELRAAVAELAAALAADGVGKGDRVAGDLPNCPEAVIAMLATTSLGAIWSSCSPDFGKEGVVDRFAQIEPKVLFAANAYRYNGKICDIRPTIAAVARALPTLVRTVIVPFVADVSSSVDDDNAVDWQDYGRPGRELVFEPVEFEHPLFIMFSSGTTGVPKCIVHGHGGTLLQHAKEHVLHTDVTSDDVLFYFTTCGWMMWNWLVSGLGAGATLVLFDGAPFFDEGRVLWEIAQREEISIFGTSAKYISAQQKAGMRPKTTHSLGKLKTILSTGSPLAPESFDYVYEAIADDVLLASISGGTDILSCFALGNPTAAVRRGELQCKGLGMATAVFDDAGQSVVGERGELVCTKPFPSAPIGFWNDTDGSRYHAAYFSRFPQVWAQGDFAQETASGGLVIYGRSDAILNPGGVRIGTAEIYRQVERLDEVIESIAVGQQWQDDVRVVLFVVLRDGLDLDQSLQEKIRVTIRENTTPRHVPAVIVAVPDIPRTRSGKIVEIAVRAVIHDEPVKNTEALANPEALQYFANLAELQDQ